MKRWRSTVATVLAVLAIVGATLTFRWACSIVMVEGDSMNPTFHNGSIVLLHHVRHPVRNDIVVFTKPDNWTGGMAPIGSRLVKRIRAVEGDTVEIKGTELTVNGVLVEDFGTAYKSCQVTGKMVVPKGTVFAMGDNYTNSVDSLYQACMAGNNTPFVPVSSVVTMGTILGSV